MKLNSYSNTFPQKAKDQMSKGIVSISFKRNTTNHEESFSKHREERIILAQLIIPE